MDKPEGITSQDVITQLQHALRHATGIRKRELPKMGHGGTLDPFATGLLIVAVGDGVKLTRYLLGSEKEYEASAKFGERTASGDRTNEVVERAEKLPENREKLETFAQTFLDIPYLQTPPMYSAKKVEGTRLYELARQGLEIERAPIECQVKKFEILETRGSDPGSDPRHGIGTARFLARVSSGTFIRTLAEDWAIRSGSLAYLTALRRTESGPHHVENATPLADLVSTFSRGEFRSDSPNFVPFHSALEGLLPSLEISSDVARRIFAGETRTLRDLPLPSADSPGSIALYAERRLVAVVREAEENGEVSLPRVIERGFPLRFGDGNGTAPSPSPENR